MTEVIVTRVDGLNTDALERQTNNNKEVSALESLRIKAILALNSFDYDDMTLSICNQAVPLLKPARDAGYKLSLLLIGPILNSKRKAQFTNYSLSRSLDKFEFSVLSCSEKIYKYPDGERTVGLYAIKWEQIEKYFLFLTRSSWAIGVISNRKSFISIDDVNTLYRAAQSHNDEMLGPDINWIKVSELVCPLGDIVVKTSGSHDDREREVNFIYTAQCRAILSSLQAS